MKDPVCGMTVKEGSGPRSTYEGTTYFFCSEPCKRSFDADPARYVDGHSQHGPAHH